MAIIRKKGNASQFFPDFQVFKGKKTLSVGFLCRGMGGGVKGLGGWGVLGECFFFPIFFLLVFGANITKHPVISKQRPLNHD